MHNFHTDFKAIFQKLKEPHCECIMSRRLIVISWDKGKSWKPIYEHYILELQWLMGVTCGSDLCCGTV